MGYSEAIYKTALYRELLCRDPVSVMEQTIPVIYKGHFLGTCRADLVTSDYVIEIKALKSLFSSASHHHNGENHPVGHQIKKYLKHIHELEPQHPQRQGLVINFNQTTGMAEFLLFQADHRPSPSSTTSKHQQTGLKPPPPIQVPSPLATIALFGATPTQASDGFRAKKRASGHPQEHDDDGQEVEFEDAQSHRGEPASTSSSAVVMVLDAK